ncbi:hypothetical protein JAAARDRAFT_196113 [Jaapia argillacea MUCL 33604]|uniref:Uncharacterized protein n=1 Tax=Jaapia argillacea MUCL 33604 TaxID=933084 RepID=A0A067PY54_9AGAM|nr:hypothetical protein JAAARDRAFT_196113 [Jaapia argillacea MUCL 33604]
MTETTRSKKYPTVKFHDISRTVLGKLKSASSTGCDYTEAVEAANNVDPAGELGREWEDKNNDEDSPYLGDSAPVESSLNIKSLTVLDVLLDTPRTTAASVS